MESEENNLPELSAFDPDMKKKKKITTLEEFTDENCDVLAEESRTAVSDDVSANAVLDVPETSSRALKSEKKKKSSVSCCCCDFLLHLFEAEEDMEDEHGDVAAQLPQPQYPWEGTDRDYSYEELLGRVFNGVHENNPELAADRSLKVLIKLPQVMREGTKRTVFVNFIDICNTTRRQSEHVVHYLLTVLGTSGSLDGQQQLVVKGRFARRTFEGIIKRYINDYVICSSCKSLDTIPLKENRLCFLKCEQCGSG